MSDTTQRAEPEPVPVPPDPIAAALHDAAADLVNRLLAAGLPHEVE